MCIWGQVIFEDASVRVPVRHCVKINVNQVPNAILLLTFSAFWLHPIECCSKDQFHLNIKVIRTLFQGHITAKLYKSIKFLSILSAFVINVLRGWLAFEERIFLLPLYLIKLKPGNYCFVKN